jgi:hypothetical protein
MNDQLVLIQVGAMKHGASSIRWRPSLYTGEKNYHTLKEGDQVVIARLSPHIWTDQSLIGHIGHITELDDMSASSVEMHCVTCGGYHTMHEDELDFMGDIGMNALRDKIGDSGALRNESISKRDSDARDLEDDIAVAMYAAGFLMPAVEDRPTPAGDPLFRRPTWSKYAYGKIWRLAPFSKFHAALVEVARSVDGVLVEWASYSLAKGWIVISHDDLDTLTLEMPIRASLQSKTSVEDTAYDAAKAKAVEWLESADKIDIGAIFRVLSAMNWKLTCWDGQSVHVCWQSFRVELPVNASAEEARKTFMEWAEKNWIWEGSFNVSVCSQSDEVAEVVEIRWFDGKVDVAVESDVPF